MPKELLIYGRVDEVSSSDFINGINEVEETEDLTVRINTNGGEPEYLWGMAAKFNEFKGNKSVKVDGKAYSAGMLFLCYADNVEALDVSEMLVHRAAYPKWYEESEMFTAEMRGNLDRINLSLRKAIEAKIDVAKFEALKGVKMKDIFSMETRIDVFLTAKEAKEIGLIDKIVKLTPTKKAEIQSYIDVCIAAEFEPFKKEAQKEEVKPKNENKMDINKLRAEHPELFAQVVKQGTDAERDRVGAWMAFVDVDAEAVGKGIKEGTMLSATAMAELSRKMFSKDTLNAAAAGAAKPLEVADPAKEKTAKEAELAAFDKNVDELLKSK